MERNQFLDCNGLIQEVAAKTQKKSAYIKIGIPDETAEKMLKQIALGDVTPITSLVLTWLDHELPQPNKEFECHTCKFNPNIPDDYNHRCRYCKYHSELTNCWEKS